MAGIVMERYFQADGFSDVSVALADPTFAMQHEGDPEPDYIMWNSATGEYFVVECKGCQTTRATALDQIRRAMEQLPTVTFVDTTRAMVSLVVATVMEETKTTVIVLDPPDDEREFKDHDVSKRVSQRKWEVESENRLVERARTLRRSFLLKWSGHNHDAALIDESLEIQRIRPEELVNTEPETRKIAGESFTGSRTPLFPELGYVALSLFRGVQSDILAAAHKSDDETEIVLAQFRNSFSAAALHDLDPYESIALDGSCFRVEGL